MKKLLVAVLAFALFAPAFAVENVQVTGDIQTIGFTYQDRGTTTLGDFKGATNRVILGIGADLVEDVYAKVTFAHENIFGDYNNAMGDGLVGESLDEIWQKTRVAEAFVKISNVFDALEVKVGRQFYGDVKSAVMYFGPTYGYADPVALRFGAGYYGATLPSYLSLEGATATYRGENLTLTAAYFAVEHDGTTLDPVDDLNLGGLDLDYQFSEQVLANAYVYDVREKSVESWGFWGIKPTIETENLKLGVEYSRNYGQHEKGWQVKADLALPLSIKDTTITPRATYLKSEKGFEAFGNYRPGLMFGTVLGGGVNNHIANVSMGGIVADWEILNVGLCMKFANLEKWGFGLDFYTGERDNVFTGNSWEAKVVYNVNQYVAFDLTGGIVTNAGHSWKHSPVAVQLGMNIKF